MTGFERNSDVVRLAATAPLFNKVVGDGQYRWTPDAIWFDNESVWKTPNYYVQQIFAKYIGKKLLQTSYKNICRRQKNRHGASGWPDRCYVKRRSNFQKADGHIQ